jgi:hypothetical protein
MRRMTRLGSTLLQFSRLRRDSEDHLLDFSLYGAAGGLWDLRRISGFSSQLTLETSFAEFCERFDDATAPGLHRL